MITIPAIDGPNSRAPFTIDELSAMALGRSARGIDDLGHERLARRHVERVDAAQAKAEDDQLADGDQVRDGQDSRAEKLGSSTGFAWR